jgi:hypothetical protein
MNYNEIVNLRWELRDIIMTNELPRGALLALRDIVRYLGERVDAMETEGPDCQAS